MSHLIIIKARRIGLVFGKNGGVENHMLKFLAGGQTPDSVIFHSQSDFHGILPRYGVFEEGRTQFGKSFLLFFAKLD